MLTRLVQRKEAVAEVRIGYEYRDAGYEYEPSTVVCEKWMEPAELAKDTLIFEKRWTSSLNAAHVTRDLGMV
jgi:hypothetical protein